MSSILTLDFETAYGKHPTTKENITLTSLTTEEYVRHPDFKVHGCGIKLGERPTKWFSGEELPEVFAKIPWRHMAVAAHHAHFDGAILNWLYGHQPLFWLDTMLMSRALWPWRSASLAKVAERCGVGKKGRELVNFKNKWWLTPDEERVLAGYCENDVDLTFDILNMLRQRLPIEELRLQDLTIRMFTEPVIEVNRSILLEEYKRELREKRAFMRQAGTDRKVLMSNDKFAAELEKLGVTPPRKISGRTGKPTYAFAKSDEGFKQLQTHEDERVQWLVEARLAVKSTIKETRAKRFYKIGSRGAFPVYLNYYGAHTGRWSGGDKQNPQNMNRYDPRDPTSGALRRSWEAPEGHVVVVRDLSQIEARVLAYWAGQEDMVEVFAGGGDPYNHMASQLYGRPVDRKNNPDDKPAGMVGKATVLGCGYGMGWAKFQESLRVGFLGMPGIIFDEEFVAALDVDVDRILSQKANRFTSYTVADMARDIKPKFIDEDTHLVHCAVTKAIIERYRKANSKIVDLWQECNEALTHIKRRMPVEIGSRPLVKTCAEGIVLPNGMILNYHDLRKSAEGWEYMTKERGPMFTKIYGGKMVENITQALARIVIAHQKLELAAEFKIASSTHDEIVMVVPRDKAEYAMARMADVMDRSPGWAPDLPLASEGGFHKSYGLCDK